MNLQKNLKRFFGTDEIESDPLLQNLHYILMIGFFVSFSSWFYYKDVTIEAFKSGRHLCPTYFQECGRLYFLNSLPNSYGQSILYATLGGLLCLSMVCAFKKYWGWAQVFMLVPFLWKVAYVTILTYTVEVDFEYFHLPFVFVYLFGSRKAYFLRRLVVLLYLMAATMKISESWIVGNYFSSLEVGMPLVPDVLIPWATNASALFEIVSPWFFLWPKKKLRYAVIALWIGFHIYSVTLVDFRFPAYCLPILLLLFLPDFFDENPSFRFRDLPGWSTIGFLLVLTILPHLFSGNSLYTLQGLKMGVRVFDANHQCISEMKIHYRDGTVKNENAHSQAAMRRCGPYGRFFRTKQLCRMSEVESVSWHFDSSVNGGPFYRLVDSENTCSLSYSAFGKNSWIRSPESGAPVVGYPGKDLPQKITYSQIPEIYKKPQIFLSPMQEWLNKNQNEIASILWAIWFLTSGYFIMRRLKKSSYFAK